MSVDVQTEIVIDRPVREVAAYVADPSHAPERYAKDLAALKALLEH